MLGVWCLGILAAQLLRQRWPSMDHIVHTVAMRYRIHHQGVPVAETEASSPDTIDLTRWNVLPGFEAIRAVVHERWDVLRPNPAGGHQGRESALHRGAELASALELRDERDALIPTTGIELRLWTNGPRELIVMVFVDEAHAGTVAKLPPEPRRAGGRLPDA